MNEEGEDESEAQKKRRTQSGKVQTCCGMTTLFGSGQARPKGPASGDPSTARHWCLTRWPRIPPPENQGISCLNLRPRTFDIATQNPPHHPALNAPFLGHQSACPEQSRSAHKSPQTSVIKQIVSERQITTQSNPRQLTSGGTVSIIGTRTTVLYVLGIFIKSNPFDDGCGSQLSTPGCLWPSFFAV